jgi:hypothetical protein
MNSKVMAMIIKGPNPRRRVGGIRIPQCMFKEGLVSDLFWDNVA